MKIRLMEKVHTDCTVQELINWCKRNGVRPKQAKLCVNSYHNMMLLTDDVEIARYSALRQKD